MKSVVNNPMTMTMTCTRGRNQRMKHTAISSMMVAGIVALSGCVADFGEGEDSFDEPILGDVASFDKEAILDENDQEETLKAFGTFCNGFKNNQWPSNKKAMETAARNRINYHRQRGTDCPNGEVKNPIAKLGGNHSLRCAGRVHSKDMATNDFFSHTGSNNSQFWQRAGDAGFTGFARNENIAAGYSTGVAVVDGWMESPGHCRAIMDPNNTKGHVGYDYRANSTWGHYWTIVFGKI